MAELPARTDPGSAPARAKLRILATTDLHMNLLGFDYHRDRPNPRVGLARTATLIAQARAEARDRTVLLFDNGDGLQGTPMGDVAVSRENHPHPLMQAFGVLRYDAIGLGNHDFNYGLEALDRIVAQAPCPVICSNMTRLDPDAPGIAMPLAILNRTVRTDTDGPVQLKIGVLSFLPPQTVIWDAHLLAGNAVVQDIVAAARDRIAELRAENCDLIVALAHSGLDPDPGPYRNGNENAAQALAALDGIDVVITGHTHLTLPGPAHSGLPDVDADAGSLHGKPAVMAGAAGTHLGVIDLDLVRMPDRPWRIDRFNCTLRAVHNAEAETPEQAQLVAELARDHAETRRYLQQSVGRIDTPLHSYFTLFGPDRSLAVLAAAQADALRPHLRGSVLAELPLISAAAPGRFGARAGPENYTDIPSGELTLRNVSDLNTYPNELRAVLVTGAQLLDWAEMSASLFRQVTPGEQRAELTGQDIAGHNFDVLHGLTYEIDLSAPARFRPDGSVVGHNSGRIRDLRCNGVSVAPEQRFVVALNSYRAAGGGNFSALRNAPIVELPRISIHDALRDYLADAPDIAGSPAPLWRFAPMSDSSVSVRTGPGAAQYLHELGDRVVAPPVEDQDGFLQLELSL